MERFPNLKSLAEASADSVLEAWSGLGYYSRARRLHQAAGILARMPDPPRRLEQLLALPGLGPYSAAAVGSIALGLPHAALDTNALRVLLRFYGWEARPDQSSVASALRARLEEGLPQSDFGITNQAIMELGAVLCRAGAPDCDACPLAPDCQARALGLQDRIPLPKPRKQPRVTRATAYMLTTEGGLLMVRGTALGLLDRLFLPPIDFHEENSPKSGLTSLLEGLRSQAPDSGVARIAYGISGRRLELEIKELDCQSEAWRWVTDCAQDLQIEVRPYRDGVPMALPSLARKILKAWSENRAGLRHPDDKSAGCGPAPTRHRR
jgi:A/G-specific adenine glycosylase